MMRRYQITNSPYPGAYHPHQPCLQRSSCSFEGRGSRLGCKRRIHVACSLNKGRQNLFREHAFAVIREEE